MFRMEKQRPLKANTSEPKVGAETGTEEQQRTENKERCKLRERPMPNQETTRHARDPDACVRAMHVHHEEETRAPLMRVTSEVRLDQATWFSSARTKERLELHS